MIVFQSSVLPREMIELILTKAVVGLCDRHRVHLEPRADVMSVVTVSSVCSEWCWIINRSRRSRVNISKILKTRKVSLFNNSRPST